MTIRHTIAALSAAAIVLVAPAGAAFAQHGADDGPGHCRHSCDDGPNHH